MCAPVGSARPLRTGSWDRLAAGRARPSARARTAAAGRGARVVSTLIPQQDFTQLLGREESKHEVVVVDVRGTGRSSPLRCPSLSRRAVVDSANAAVNTVATDVFVKLTKNTLNLTGDEIGRHVKSTDGPRLFSPLEVITDGKDRLGAILTLDDRAVLGWTVGTFRMKNFETVIPYSSIESIELGTRAGESRETL